MEMPMAKADDYQGFRWRPPECDRHFKMLPMWIVAQEAGGGFEPSFWASLGRSAHALLPVLLRHSNTKGEAYPGEGRLAAMSGLTRKTVRSAARELQDRVIIKISTRITRKGRTRKTYHLPIPDEDEARGVFIPSIQIDGGNWACLKPSAKSLAVAFWFFSSVRPDLYPGWECWVDPDEIHDFLAARNFDYSNADPINLREFAGIGPRVYPDAIRDLQKHHFIEADPDHDDYWRVFVWPSKICKVAYLNSIIDGEEW